METNRTRKQATLVALLATALAATAYSADLEEKIADTLTMKEIKSVDLGHVKGEIRVTTGEDGKVVVAATKRTTADTERRAEEMLDRVNVEIETSGDSVQIKTVYDKESFWEKLKNLVSGEGFPEVEVDVDLQVPQGASLSISTVSGTAYVKGVQGGLSFKGVSGDLEILDLDAGASLHMVSGDIELIDVRGDLSAKTVSGDLMAHRLEAGSIDINSVSGDIALNIVGSRFSGMSVNTVSGKVGVSLPAGVGTSLKVQTVSGKLSAQPPLPAPPEKGAWELKLGAGEVEARIRTVSGDVTVAVGAVSESSSAPEASGAKDSGAADPSPAPSQERAASATSGAEAPATARGPAPTPPVPPTMGTPEGQ